MPEHTAESILSQARAFMQSRILLTAAELDLFTILDDQPSSASRVADLLSGDLRALRMILDALVAMKLLAKSDGTYSCAEGIGPLLSAKSEESVLPMVLHMAGLYQSWGRLTQQAIGSPAEHESPVGLDDYGRLKAFIGAMHVVSHDRAKLTAQEVDPRSEERLLDVGGASGTFVMAFIEQAPGMKATIFDRPAVVEMARERLGKAGLLGQVELVAGDYNIDELPQGHDLALLSAIIHQNSPEQNQDLYYKVFRALEPGGRVVIRDHVMEPDRTEPPAGAIFAINMLANTEGGGCYTLEEIRKGLEQAGFEDVEVLRRDSVMDGLVQARKPKA
ncbi:MAG: methyltransferase domain-containing protein [Armatimonadia bacterium]|nr:methyltransferase domain-containing protein [Armatimonadia bacterium]